MNIVIRITGKARHVFKLIGLFAMYRGEDTIGKIVDQNRRSAMALLNREGELATSLTKDCRQYQDIEILLNCRSHERRQEIFWQYHDKAMPSP